MFAAQLLEQLQAAAVGQHHVEHHGVRRLPGEGGAGAGAVVAGAHLEAFLLQPGGEQLGQFAVVVDQQQVVNGGRGIRAAKGQGRTWRNGLTSTSAYTPAAR